MKVAVVGYVEWTRFALVERAVQAGEIIFASDSWCEASGGGGTSAATLARLAGNCTLFTAFGDDEIGRLAKHQLEQLGVEVRASVIKNHPSNYGFCQLDASGERTITLAGHIEPSGLDTSLPWDELAGMDAVYFMGGDAAALKFARKARILVSTARTLPVLKTASLPLEALTMSASDASEKYADGDLEPAPKLVIKTDGDAGASAGGQHYPAETVSRAEFKDSYGCGDSFAAGLTYALAQNLPTDEALALANHCGAEAARRRGGLGLEP